MTGDGRVMIAGADNQFAAAQILQRGLDGALGKAGRFRERAQTRGHRFPFAAGRLTVEMQVNKIRGRLSIVPDDVTHQDINDVVVDRNGCAKAGHKERMKEEGRRMKVILQPLYR